MNKISFIGFILAIIGLTSCAKNNIQPNSTADTSEQPTFLDSVALFHNEALEKYFSSKTKALDTQNTLECIIDNVIENAQSVLIEHNVDYSLEADKEIIYEKTKMLIDRIALNNGDVYLACYSIIDEYFSGDEARRLRELLENDFAYADTKNGSQYQSVVFMGKIGQASSSFWATKGFFSDGSAATDALAGAVGLAFSFPISFLFYGASIAWSAATYEYSHGNVLDYVRDSTID